MHRLQRHEVEGEQAGGGQHGPERARCQPGEEVAEVHEVAAQQLRAFELEEDELVEVREASTSAPVAARVRP